MSPNDEILSIIRYAPGPIGAAGIYERCKSIENITDVSSRLSQLYAQGKVAREEITTPNNRKGYAYTLPRPAADRATPNVAVATPDVAQQEDAPVSELVIPTLGSGDDAHLAKPSTAGAARRRRGSRMEAALKDSQAPAAQRADEAMLQRLKALPPMRERGRGDPAPDGTPKPDDAAAALAGAILAHVRRQLAPQHDAQPLHIHIAHLEIHL